MADSAKSSLRRSKPSYIYSIVGVALVLLIMGVMGWVFLNFGKAGNSFKEDIRISAYLRTQNKDTITQIKQFITAQPYARSVEYVDKEKQSRFGTKTTTKTGAKYSIIILYPKALIFMQKPNM